MCVLLSSAYSYNTFHLNQFIFGIITAPLMNAWKGDGKWERGREWVSICVCMFECHKASSILKSSFIIKLCTFKLHTTSIVNVLDLSKTTNNEFMKYVLGILFLLEINHHLFQLCTEQRVGWLVLFDCRLVIVVHNLFSYTHADTYALLQHKMKPLESTIQRRNHEPVEHENIEQHTIYVPKSIE